MCQQAQFPRWQNVPRITGQIFIFSIVSLFPFLNCWCGTHAHIKLQLVPLYIIIFFFFTFIIYIQITNTVYLSVHLCKRRSYNVFQGSHLCSYPCEACYIAIGIRSRRLIPLYPLARIPVLSTMCSDALIFSCLALLFR